MGGGARQEVREFIQRCVANIQDSPESMQAGLSSLLLKTIAVTSRSLQEMVATDVYLNIVDQIVSSSVKIVNEVAYLTVLISLTQTIADTESSWTPPLAELTIQDEATCRKLEQILEKILQIGRKDASQMEQIELVHYEKLLYLYCAVRDLEKKILGEKASDSTPASLGRETGLNERILKSVAETLAAKILSGDQSTMPKICFATLAREAKRKPCEVSRILHEVYITTALSRIEVIKAFFSGDLMGDVASAKLGFELYESVI